MSAIGNNEHEDPEYFDRLRLFSALGSETRLRMLEKLTEGEMHIFELARKLDISVPVAAKHANVLEAADLIQRKVYGKTHVLQFNDRNLFKALDIFAPSKTIEVKKGTTMLEALKKVAVVEVRNIGGQENIVSTNGEEGFFVYEVNGDFSDKAVSSYAADDANISSLSNLLGNKHTSIDLL